MLNRENTVLVVVDLQDSLLSKIKVGDDVVDQTIKLIKAADILEVPVIFTEQYPKGLGPTTKKIADLFASRTPFEKTAFGCFEAQGFPELVAVKPANQLLLVGIEAHVCVMQTALQARTQGFDVYVPRDAVASRNKSDAKAGLARMEANGVQLVTAEMAVFELLRAAGTPEFKKMLPLIKEL